jgi:hypothetical protein
MRRATNKKIKWPIYKSVTEWKIVVSLYAPNALFPHSMPWLDMIINFFVLFADFILTREYLNENIMHMSLMLFILQF